MTVGELIEQLQQLPRDTEVLVQGYENGYDAAGFSGNIVKFRPADAPAWYDGDYILPDEDDGEDARDFEAVLLFRK